MARARSLGHVAHRLELGRRVVLGDDDHRRRQAEPDQRAEVERHRRRPEHLLRNRIVGDRRDDAGDDHAAIQRAHDLAAFGDLDEERADDRGDDRHRAEHERIENGCFAEVLHHQAREQHRRDDGDRVGLEEVRSHAGAVADVVADVVRDHGGIARVVLGDAGFDLSYQVRPDVGTLGEDAAAEPREDRDQRAAEGESDERVQRVIAVAREPHHHAVIGRDAEQPEADDQHAGDRAAAECDLQRRIEPDARGVRGAHVRAHRDVHADVAGHAGEECAERETDGRVPVERESERDEQHDADDGDGRVLAVQVGLGACLDRGGNLLHPRVARGLREDPARHEDAVHDGDHAGQHGQPECGLHGHELLPGNENHITKVVDSRRRTRAFFSVAYAGIPFLYGGLSSPAISGSR